MKVRQGGFSLVEALVALVVLSLGVLSVAAMQFKAMQSVRSGYQQSLASVAALDAQERVWAAIAHVEGCQSVPVASIESAWRDAWFLDEEAPLKRSVDPAQSAIGRSGCQFDVTVKIDVPDDENGIRLEYRFLLPL
ncbi:prepilin-type N-terminal cleavage/methylation domain-containing protein [Vreelandella aquamarina]|uniref:Pilus assembly protein PilV n=1 Tax=Vreelandella aquamarina TaxID=77097 RepID=A0A857GP74_9GAMM|nr:prepilin-type N-terminal cleavage/methylation domain-containing protein [Halomonas meridiana]QHD51012.1 pilus assembly protein PilV [Halomonas meridiana]